RGAIRYLQVGHRPVGADRYVGDQLVDPDRAGCCGSDQGDSVHVLAHLAVEVAGVPEPDGAPAGDVEVDVLVRVHAVFTAEFRAPTALDRALVVQPHREIVGMVRLGGAHVQLGLHG